MNERYQAYLVRFIRSEENKPWRVTLQDVHNQERRHFSTEKELFQFLEERLEQPQSASETRNQSLK